MEDDCFLIDHKARTYTQNKRVITALTPNIAGTTREVPGDTIIEGYSCRKVIFEIEPLEDRPEIQAYAWISRDLRLPKWKRGDTEVGLMSIDAGEEGTILFLSMEIAGAMKLAFHLVSAHPEILEDEIFSIPEGYTQVD